MLLGGGVVLLGGGAVWLVLRAGDLISRLKRSGKYIYTY